MKWDIREYETNNKERPVANFIKKQRPHAIAKIIHTISLLETYGPLLTMPHARKITSHLYELRIRGKEEIRIVYGFVRGTIYLLHCFKKQSQKTPINEIETAQKRYATLT